jgi:multicomponent Na+:H+ antiporter subunit E
VKYLVLFLSLIIIWLMMTWSLDGQELLAGVLLAALLALFQSKLYRTSSTKFLNPMRWIWFVEYILNFIYFCIKANLDVAYRVLHPDVPIRPAIVKVKTDLQTDIAKTFLANSITLTPGTLTIDIEDNDLYIHWINVVSDNPEEQTEIIVKRFEKILRRVFE